MDYYQHHNLRTFQFFLSKVNYLLERLSEISYDVEYEKNICEHIISETFSQAIKLKANYKPRQTNWIGLSNEQNITSTLIKNYVENGEFLFDSFKKDILTIQEQLKASVPKDDSYYLLYQQYYLHTQKWCEEQLNKMIEQLRNNRYPISFYGKIIIAVQRLLDLGFDDSYMQQIKNYMIENIFSMGEVKLIEEELWMINDKHIKEKIRVVIAEINDVITTHSEKTSCVTIREILKKDNWIDRLDEYIKLDQTYSVRDVPIFSKAEVREWVNKLNISNPKEIDHFRNWLGCVYPNNQPRKSYSQDADSIKNIKSQLEKLNETDLIKKACNGWLVNQFNQIIQCNESMLEEIVNRKEDMHNNG